jgi:hypothetical protein
VPTGGRAEIVRDDASRSEPFDFQPGTPHGKVLPLVVSLEPSDPATSVLLLYCTCSFNRLSVYA